MKLLYALSACLIITACAANTTDNLIGNPGAEIAENVARPAGWSADSWGLLSANLSWEGDGGFDGSKYLSVSIQNYSEGDAKWIFDRRKLEKNTWYEYSDYHRSDGRNRLIWKCTTPENQHLFRTVWQSDKSENWTRSGFRFYNSEFPECEVTIMHVLDRNGYLHTDQHQLIKVEPKPLKRPLVSVTFDDIYATAVDTGAAELEKRGWKGSYYVTGEYARLTEGAYAHVPAIKQLIAAGHEIGSHSATHAYLSRIGTQELVDEIQGNYDYLKFLGQEPTGLAYPFGDFTGEVEAEVHRFHGYARTSLVGLNDATADPYRLRILPVTKETTTSELFGWIEDAERTSTWLILLYHDLQDGQGEPLYTTPITQYIQVLDYLKRKNLNVVTVKEGLKELKEVAGTK